MWDTWCRATSHADDDPTNSTEGERWMGMMAITRGAGADKTRQAIDEYRDEHGIDDELVRIDNCSVYWRRK